MTTSPSRTTNSPAETEEAGERLGGQLRSGDVVLLTGELGAGKTTFVRGVARGTGSRGPVASPPFQLVRGYPGRVPPAHADLYPVEETRELPDLGLEGLARQGAMGGGWGSQSCPSRGWSSRGRAPASL